MRLSKIRFVILGSITIVGVTSILLGLPLLQGRATLATKAHAASAPSPVGRWNLTVTSANTGQKSASTMEFDANSSQGGTCYVYTPGKGNGVWVATSSYTFHYHFDEQLYDNSGNYIGHVVVDQDASFSADGSTFYAWGQGVLYSPQGTPLFVNPTNTVATRA